MTREERLDWLCRLRSDISYMVFSIDIEVSLERKKQYRQALSEEINDLQQEPCDCISRETIKNEMMKYGFHAPDMTVTEFVEDILLPSIQPKPKTGHWILQPSNKEQGERDFIWWKCSECGQVIYSETEQDRREYHAYCGRCGAKMIEPQESEVKK